ncbi:MAG: 4Fe-4S dicluster domain-containing protein [FCB group bacterium]|jgi:heterodisulfide reductase subunit C
MVATHKNPIVEEIIEITGQDPSICYQCGKCSAGCPVREFALLPPNKIVRFFQLGFYDLALNSATIWLCAGCLTCTSRCPKNFDLAAFMDAVRQVAIRHGASMPDDDVVKFHEAFLDQIKNHGRAYEMGLVMEYKLNTMHLLQDMDVAPTMFFKGKIGIMPHNIKNRSIIKEIFKKTGEENKK